MILLAAVLTFLSLILVVIFSQFLSIPNPGLPYDGPLPPLSIVICSRNDLGNLKENLPFLLSQIHPELQFVLVDDASTDGTFEFLTEMAKSDDRIEVIQLEESDRTLPGKRNALKKGIEAAMGNHLLLTDSDCRPLSAEWAKKMHSAILNSKAFAGLGAGIYQKEKEAVNLMARLENVFTAMLYLSAARSGRPFMGVGRNLIYCNSIKEHLWVLDNHRSPSGDDDLLINHFSKTKSIIPILDREVYVISRAPSTLQNWLNQKARHYRSGSEYRLRDQVFLGVFWTGSAAWWILLVGSFLLTPGWALLNLVLVGLIAGWALNRWGHALLSKDIAKFGLLLWPLYILNMSIAGIWMKINKNDLWK